MAFISLPLVVALAAGAILIKVLRSLFSKSPSVNPFQGASTFKVRPKVTDQEQRKAVLKQVFCRKEIPDQLDAIVIGSGIGGLAAAAILAKSGKKVLVLEQHNKAGGCCHTFIKKDYEFDVGIHYIPAEVNYHSLTKTYLDQITGGQLEWAPLDENYDEIIFAEKDKELRKYPVYSGKDKWKMSLKKRFPKESANIDKFFEILVEIKDGEQISFFVKFIPLWCVWILEKTGLINFITNFFKWNARTCKEVVWGLTQNQELRDIFCYCFLAFATPPSKSGFPIQAIIHAYFQTGCVYPVGGASEIAFHIIPVIEASGGKVLVRAEVQKIHLNSDGKACGVQVKKGKELIDVAAPIIISDAGLYNTLERLLPSNVAASSRLWPLVKNSEHGPGIMSVFVGLDCPVEDLDVYQKKNAWLIAKNDIDKATVDYYKLSREEAMDIDIPVVFVSFSSTKDPEWSKRFPGKTTMILLAPMPYEWLEEWKDEPVKKRGDEYDGIKNIFGHKAIDQACRIFPSIRDHIDFVSIGTPLTNRHYLGAPKGESYGLDHTVERFSVWNKALLRPETDISGLYLTGQDITFSGFLGGLWGGLLCAGVVLKRDVMKDLTLLYEKNKFKSE